MGVRFSAYPKRFVNLPWIFWFLSPSPELMSKLSDDSIRSSQNHPYQQDMMRGSPFLLDEISLKVQTHESMCPPLWFVPKR
jgi:hypothetical protein